MLKKYWYLFAVSMLPIVELRGGVPIGVGMGFPFWQVYLVCVLGNLLPVPFLLLFGQVIYPLSLVSSPNPASERLHEALGFRRAGVQKNAGYKNGRWIDLLWFEKAIAPYDPEPAPIIPVRELPGERVQEVLERFFRI